MLPRITISPGVSPSIGVWLMNSSITVTSSAVGIATPVRALMAARSFCSSPSQRAPSQRHSVIGP